MLDVRRMRVLREVAQRGSFSAAAEALSFTQSAVSQQIAALEREAGTTLVERSVRGIRLTDAGRALVRHTEAILGRLAEAEAELEAIAGLRGGRLRMASFESAGATLMPLAIATFRERHPAVELSLSLAEPMDSLPKLKSGELEIALTFDPNDVAVAERRLDRARPPARRPALPRARPRPPARQQAQPAPGRPRGRRLDRGHAQLRLRGDDAARLRAGRLRPADRVRVRRLRGDPGLRGGRRRRRADRRARADHRARRHRDPLARARDAAAPHPRRRARRRLPLARPPRRCSRS